MQRYDDACNTNDRKGAIRMKYKIVIRSPTTLRECTVDHKQARNMINNLSKTGKVIMQTSKDNKIFILMED